MSAGGWFLMIMMVGVISSMFFWCIWKVHKTPDPAEHIHNVIDLDTPDQHED